MLKAPKPGEPITSAFLTALAAEVGRRIMGGQGIDVKHTTQGVVIKLNTNAAIPGQSPPRWQEYRGD